jgi:hypothetical protein
MEGVSTSSELSKSNATSRLQPKNPEKLGNSSLLVWPPDMSESGWYV